MPLEGNISELSEKLYYLFFFFRENLKRSLECGIEGKRRLSDAAINSVGELRQKLRKQELT